MPAPALYDIEVLSWQRAEFVECDSDDDARLSRFHLSRASLISRMGEAGGTFRRAYATER